MNKKLHKYIGIPFCILLFLAGLSGIITNHRKSLQSINVPKWLLPDNYTYKNWNLGAVRSTLECDTGQYLYGTAGVWLRPKDADPIPLEHNKGLGTGADERKVLAMARDSLGGIWLITQYKLYKERSDGSMWQEQSMPQELNERLTDLLIRGDSLILLSRSHIYTQKLGAKSWKQYSLKPSEGHQRGLLLFQLVWAWHNGEYFGRWGQTLVDLLGVILMLLSATGLAYSYYSLRIKGVKKRSNKQAQRQSKQRLGQALARQFRWHRSLGRWLFYPLLFIFVSGWMLRPPLMLSLLHNRLEPWRISHLYSNNPWHDRLRAIRYDEYKGQWLISSSTGFYTLEDWHSSPKAWQAQPSVSPMGINAFAQRNNGDWLIGSFSGMYRVDSLGQVWDYFTQELAPKRQGKPFAKVAIAGIKLGNTEAEDILFDYDKGAICRRYPLATPNDTPKMNSRGNKGEANNNYQVVNFLKQTQALEDSPYSLWQWALEVHTGRIYQPLIGKLGSEIFIFPFGLLALIVLITGYLRLRPHKRKKIAPITT